MTESVINRNSVPRNDDTLAAMPDGELVTMAVAGRAEAFEALIHRYFTRVHAIAYAHLRDAEAAEDLAQEVFLRAYLKLRDLHNPAVFAPWITQMTRNEAISWLRSQVRRSRLVKMIPLEKDEIERAADVVQLNPAQHLE